MNAIEELRKKVIVELMSLNSIKTVWPVWEGIIKKTIQCSDTNSKELQTLGNSLYDIFKSTSSGRGQGDVSGGGAAWEALVCWYLNLCLLGSRTVIIKSKKDNVPTCIFNAISVNYGNFQSNTESDLLAITFPDNNQLLQEFDGSHSKMMLLFNKVVENNFRDTELGIIQCKTNWNDNAQIPMLWDLIYASDGFTTNATVGCNGFSHKNLKKFTYSFVTVPTVKPDTFKVTSTAVMRVRNLSGSNYWGRKSQKAIASNLFDIIQRNFATSHGAYPNSWHLDICHEIKKMRSEGNYFKL